MKTKSNDQYLTNYEWFIDVLNDESVILCYGSALECLELFTGYLGESEIDVYAKEKGIYENINYRIVDNFDGIETFKIINNSIIYVFIYAIFFSIYINFWFS